MAKAMQEMTLAELRQMLTKKKSVLQKLILRRKRIEKSLAKLDKKIDVLSGGEGLGRGGPRGKRAKNAKSLKLYVLDVLAKNKKGLALGELYDKVTELGYKSKASNFKLVVYQCVYHLMKKRKVTKDNGRYCLAAGAESV